MTTLHDVRAARKKHEAKFAEEIVITYGVTVVRNGKVAVEGTPSDIWVLPFGVGEPVAVLNRRIRNNRPNIPVEIGFASPQSTVLEVLRVVVSTGSETWYESGLDMLNHAASHLVGSDDPLYIYARAVVMLLCYPTGETGLSIHVSPYVYRVGQQIVRFNGLEYLSLASHEPPANYKVNVLVYLDRDTNTVGTVAGTPVLDNPLVEVPDPLIPEGSTPSALVRLVNGQTEVVEADFVADVRDFLAGSELVEVAKMELLERLGWLENEIDVVMSKHMVEG